MSGLRGKAVFIAAVVLASLIILPGCGEKTRVVKGQEFTASKLPGAGTSYTYYVNLPLSPESEGIPVNFSLESSWNFSDGPTETQQKSTLIEPRQGRGVELFPESNLCLQREISEGTLFIFYFQDEKVRQQLGTYLITSQGQELWTKYTPPMTILKFPLELSNTWSEEITFTNSQGYVQNITRQAIVRWVDSITVPAGSYPEASMIQYFDISKADEMSYREIYYAWYVPGVGQVAFMKSFQNETQPAFSRAVEFGRLISMEKK